MPDAPDDLPARGSNGLGALTLEQVPAREVDRDEEPPLLSASAWTGPAASE